MELRIVALVFLLSTFAYVVHCEICHICNITEDVGACEQAVDCGNNFGCYSHTWFFNGKRYYRKGCSESSPTPCGILSVLFCTLDFATICCSEDRCNSPNPTTVWRPQRPENVRLSTLSSSSVTLDWAIQCNERYRYQVDYSRPGEQLQTLSNIDGTMMYISGLYPGYYQFSVRSFYDDRFSEVSTIHRRVPFANETGHTLCASVENKTISEANSTTLQACLVDHQRCFTVLNYYTDGGQAFVSRGCLSAEACTSTTTLFRDQCRPGVANAFCNFCCEGNGCNSDNALISSNLVCHGISYGDRINCGWEGINSQTCLSRGCCYEETSSIRYEKWCYHKRHDPSMASTTAPTTTNPPEVYVGGVVYWVFIVIILAILIFILIIALIVYCIVAKKRRKQRGIYEVEAIYATPHRNYPVRTVSTAAMGNTSDLVQESP